MSWVIRIVWFLFKQQAEMKIIDVAKVEAIEAYLKVLASARQVCMAILLFLGLIQLLVLSLLGFVVGSVLLLDVPMILKIEILMGVFATVLVLSAWVLISLTRESWWYQVSGAEKLVDEFKLEHQAMASGTSSSKNSPGT